MVASLIDPAWWFGAADYALKLVAIAAALVALQVFQAVPSLSWVVNEDATNDASPSTYNPHMTFTLHGFDVQIQSGSAADVQNIVLRPIGDYIASPTGTDHIHLLASGATRRVAFVLASGAKALTVSEYSPPLVDVSYDRNPVISQASLRTSLELLLAVFFVGLLLSIASGRPLAPGTGRGRAEGDG